jgi:uncharacterized protein
VILPDINLLLHAHNRDAPHHEAARTWWETLLHSATPVALPWAVSVGFIRLMTHRAVLVRPLEASLAVAHVRSWLVLSSVEPIDPGPRHLEILDRLFEASGVAGGLTTDAHLAALATEHQCELHSNDTDFARFPGLRWTNPIES